MSAPLHGGRRPAAFDDERGAGPRRPVVAWETTAVVLDAALEQLKPLVAGDAQAARELAELERRRREDVLRLLVVGEAKRGKSTLLNALVGCTVLPTGVVPLTSVVTVLRHGATPRCSARYRDGREQLWPIEQIADLVTQVANPGNVRDVAEVVVDLPSPLLALGVELVDTPGVGSVHDQNTTEAQDALRRMDAAILVLTSDPPISASERAFLRQVRGQAVTVLCVLNKIDRLNAQEREQAVAFVRTVLDAELGSGAPLWPMSARRGEAGDVAGGDGLGRFRGGLESYLAERRATDLTGSLLSRTRWLAAGARTQAELTLAALSAGEQDLRGRLLAFSNELDAARLSQQETKAVARGRVRALLDELNEGAASLTSRQRDDVVAAATTRLASASAGERPAALEEAALCVAAERIAAVVGGWQVDRAAWLEQQLNELDRRISSRVDGHVQAVRLRAGELFQVRMHEAHGGDRLMGRQQLGLSFASDPGNVDALATFVRTHLPGPVGRRRVVVHVRERATDLLDRNVGRARAELQRQLIEAGRLLERAVDRRFEEGTRTISTALQHGSELRRGGEVTLRAQRSALQDQHRELTLVLNSLDDRD